MLPTDAELKADLEATPKRRRRRRRELQAQLDERRRLYGEIVELNKRLAMSHLERRIRGVPIDGDKLDVLEAAAMEGLFHAATQYNPNSAAKFGTYADFGMMTYVDRAIHENFANDDRLRVYRLSERKRINAKVSKKFDDDTDSLDLIGRLDPSYDRVELADAVQAAVKVANLSPRESLAIDLRYGLTSGVPFRLWQVGEEMGVSQERARQIIDRAVSKLKMTFAKAGLTPENWL